MLIYVSMWLMLDSSSNSFPCTRRTFVSYLYGRITLLFGSPAIFSQIVQMDFSVPHVQFDDVIYNDLPDIRSFKFNSYGKYHATFS